MTKTKGGLGRGLSALIGKPVQPERSIQAAVEPMPPTKTEGEMAQIELARIRPNPYQPRAEFNHEALDELKDSIKQKGIIQPVTLRRTGDGMYELISGERRIRASMELGLKTIPAYVIEVKKDEEMLELALIENLQREHLNPVEIAISYQRLVNDVGMSPEDVAKKVSKDRTTVVNFLRLLKLPEKILQSLRKGQITAGHARALVALPDELTQVRLFEHIIKDDLNVRQIEKLVQHVGKKPERKPSLSSRADVTVVSDMETRIQQIFGTKVKIHIQEGGRGEIVIEFYSNDDLSRLYEMISALER